jgi:hypothetical protein
MSPGRLLLGAGIVAVLAGCGDEERHYTYAQSIDCFKDVGKTQVMGSQTSAVRITADQMKAFDVLFLPSGARAKNYVKQFKVPNGILHTKGNAIVYGHQTGQGGPEVSDDDMKRVEKCLA